MWLWIPTPGESIDNEKHKIETINRVIDNVKSGYKGDENDFAILVGYIKELFDTSAVIDEYNVKAVIDYKIIKDGEK
jgi:hypothetical protein